MTAVNDDQPWWQIWATRILVTAVLAFALEYLGRQPLPERTNEPNEESASEAKFSPLQYGDLSTTKDPDQSGDVAVVDTDKPEEEQLLATSDNDMDTMNSVDDDDDDDDGNEEENTKSVGSEKAGGADQNEAANQEDQNSDDDSAEYSAAAAAAASSSPATPPASEPKEIEFKNKSSAHPGLDGFHRWYDVETSLYRQYQVGRTDGVEVYPNYVPHSRRGTVKLHLRVTNQMTHRPQSIDVYWINYKGGEDHKGKISRGETWHQTTWIEHPWVFRLSDTQELLLHYIPDRIIQHLDEAPTSDENDPTVGVQRFTFRAPTPDALTDNHICSIDDPILPHPASHHFKNANQAHNWTLLHMRRQEYFTYHPGAQLLTKYLTNIMINPDKPSYRKIRIANKHLYQAIWQTAARGLLLAAGFVEQNAYAELGTAGPLPGSRVQDISTLLFRLKQTIQSLEDEKGIESKSQQQPDGADGRGRAGFGLAGERNPRV